MKNNINIHKYSQKQKRRTIYQKTHIRNNYYLRK